MAASTQQQALRALLCLAQAVLHTSGPDHVLDVLWLLRRWSTSHGIALGAWVLAVGEVGVFIGGFLYGQVVGNLRRLLLLAFASGALVRQRSRGRGLTGVAMRVSCLQEVGLRRMSFGSVPPLIFSA